MYIANLKKSKRCVIYFLQIAFICAGKKKDIDWKMIKIGRNEVYFKNSFDSFRYLHEKSCKIFFVWLTVCVVGLPIFNLGIFLKIPKKDLIMLVNISLLKLCQKSKEKSRNLIFQNLIFQVNRYDKEVSLNVVTCLLIVLKHHHVSQKPS